MRAQGGKRIGERPWPRYAKVQARVHSTTAE